jgi:cell division protein FtsA
VTSDLALRISIDTAEQLKLHYGDLTVRDSKGKENDEEIDLSKLSNMETMSISRNFMNDIIRARYEEILHHIVMELKKVGRDGMLPEGIVITGGAAKMRGLVELARTYMRLPASIGVPDMVDGVSGTSISDPIYSSVVGNLLLIQKYGTAKRAFKVNFSLGNIFGSLKNIFKKIMP